MDDKAIMALFEVRSEAAIVKTSEKYGKYLFKISWNVLHRHEDAEECVNDTYFTAWQQIPPDKPKKFLPYLGRITRALSLNRYNFLKAQKRNSHFDVLLSELEDCLTSVDSVESTFEAKELARSMNDFLERCKKEHRIIFVRRYWYGDSLAIIAELRNTTESNVKSILFRTRKKLESHLRKEGFLNE